MTAIENKALIQNIMEARSRRMADGQLRELTEYMDKALVDRVLQPPAWRSVGESES